MNPIKTTAEIFNLYALDYQNKYMNVDLYKDGTKTIDLLILAGK